MKKANRTIIIIEDSSKVNFGGGQRVTLSIAKILYKYTKNILLFDTTQQSFFYLTVSKYSSKKYNIFAFGEIRSGLSGTFYKIFEAILFPILLLWNSIIVYINIKNIKNKVLYTTTKKSLLIAYCLNYCCGIPFIYHAHLIEKKSIVIFILEKVLSKAEMVIAVSISVLNSINKCPNICVIPNPIEGIACFYPRVLKKKVIVGLFASLIKIKGVDYFIESHNYLKHNCDVFFWIFGEGVEKEGLLKRANSHIIFKGFTDNTIMEMNNHVDILCFPSIVEESFGISIIEAFSCGIPVITTNIGGQAELVENGKNGFLVPIMSSIAIAEKIDYLIDNPSVYNEISEHVIKKSADYVIDKFEKKILRVFF